MSDGLKGYTQGGEGYLGIKITWRPDDATDPNAWAAPDQFILADTKNLDQAYTHIEHDVYVGSRDTDKGHRHGKAMAGGPFTTGLYPTNGSEVWEAALGFKGTVDALSPDTTTMIQNGALAPPTAPTTTPSSGSGGTLLAGTYKYAVTFVTAYGETTLGAQTAGDILAGTSADALSAIPVDTKGIATARNIYRKKDAGPFALVHTLADNTTAVWNDTGAAAGAAPPVYNTSLPSGISVLGLTTGDLDYAVPSKGRPVEIDTGLNQEIRTVLDYNIAKKLLYVALLGERDGIEIEHTSAGTVVVAPECSVERPITPTDFSRNYSGSLPRIAAEDNIAGTHSWRYRSGYVGKLDLKASAAKVEVSADMTFNKPRVLANGEGTNPDPTAFDDTEADLEDLSFEYQDGFLAMESDTDSFQVPMLQRFDDAVSFELNFNNNLKEEATMDGTDVKRFFPGAKRKLDVKMEALNPADYPPIYEKFLKKDKDAQFFAQFAINEGTDTTPVWKFRSFYCPHVRYVKSSEKQGLTDTKSEVVEGVARRASGLEKVYVYSIT